MTISFRCPSCGSPLRAPTEHSGKKAACKKCGERFVVPADVAVEVLEDSGAPTSQPLPTANSFSPVVPASVVHASAAQPAPRPAAAPAAAVPRMDRPATESTSPARTSAVASTPAPSATRPGMAQAHTVTQAGPGTSSSSTETVHPVLTVQQLDAAFVGAITKVPLSIGYKLSLLVVAFCMVLLPLVYVALIVLLAYGAVQYALHGTVLFEGASNSNGRGAAKAAVLFYVGPLVIAAITIVFMVKPFFARMPKAAAPRSLKREEQPVLFDFVERICNAVGAPMPKRIDVDTEVNATASFRNGWLSLLQPNDLVLTIGLPLVKGLTARELGGVLAHEFGHFSQGMGMRLSYVIRSISHWFARVVYQRDRADEWLAAWAQAIDIRLGIVLYVAMAVVWLTRRILWCLMMIGHIVSSILLRQMEYDADSYEIQLGGSKSFASTFNKLQTMGLAYQRSMSEAQSFFTDGKLVDDLPQLAKVNHQMLTSEDRQKLNELLQQQKSSWFDTHPSDKDRIAAGQKMNAPGMLHLEAPAEALLINASQLSRAVTRDFYVNMLEDKYSDSMLASVDELTSFKQDASDADEARKRMFGEAFTNPRAMYLGLPANRHQPAQESIDILLQTKRQMEEALPQYTELSKQFDTVDTRWLDAQRALALLSCDMKLKQADWKNLVIGSKESLQSTVQQAQSELAQLHNQLLAFEQAFARRVDAALQWLFMVSLEPHNAHTQLVSLSPLLEKAQSVLTALNAIDQVMRVFLDVRNDFLVVYSVVAAAEGNLSAKQGVQLNLYGNRLLVAIPKLLDNFQNVPYPFEHAQGAMSITKFLLPQGLRPQDIGQAMEMSTSVLGDLQTIYFRSIGTLSAIIEKVEAAAETLP